MKVSLNWVRYINDKYQTSANPAPNGVEDLVQKIGAQLGAVEEVINIGERYEGIVVVKVISAVKHPNADKLKVCWVDDAGVINNVPRNNVGHVEVVCGAPNVDVGQLVAWIPPGASVPSSYDSAPFVIEKRGIRGVVSNGMLASPKELDLGDSHEGLLIIDQPAKPGQPFAKVYDLDDYVIDIENKMFTHRPDLFGILGIAREIAGIQHKTFKSPDWYTETIKSVADGRKNVLNLSVKNDLPKMVPRFCAIAIKDVKVAPSPIWLQTFLLRVGIRPINNIVDITNYVMHETGQPLHAFDYDKVKTGVLGVRYAKTGESLDLLNGKSIKLTDDTMVITDCSRPISLAGIMGGANTEVSEDTKNIILECANFDMNRVRKTAMQYGLFTDAVTRFTKNQSPLQNPAVITKAAKDVISLAGGTLASMLLDDNHTSKSVAKVDLDIDFINERLGSQLSSDEAGSILQNVEFGVSVKGQKLAITVPFWRTDIKIPEDIVEEVGRLYGYDKLSQKLPRRQIEPVAKNELIELKNKIRQTLSSYGASELLTYSFVHANLLIKTGQDPKQAYKLSNAISPNLHYYRFNLLPSLLDKVHPNIKAGYDKFALFEIGKGHDQSYKNKEGLPGEFEQLSLVYTASSKTNPQGAAYYQVKRYLDDLAASLGLKLVYSKTGKLVSEQMSRSFDMNRTAYVHTASGKLLGVIGEFKSSVRQSLKLPDHTAGFEIDLQTLAEVLPDTNLYLVLGRFPETYQDLCLRTKADLSYAELTSFVEKLLIENSVSHGYIYQIDPVDIYQREGDGAKKQTTWRITLSHPDRTLTTEEVNKLLDKIAGQAKAKHQAERV